jgi:hypothetical protein
VVDFEADARSDRAEAGVHVTRTGHGTHQVELWGSMPIGWLGNFSRGATLMRLDIVRGVARRNTQRRWSATFEMQGASESSMQRIDFLGLARVGVESPAPIALELQRFELQRFELTRFELTRSAERAGMLELRVNARDRTGFLAALLGHLAGFVLFPEEIRIDTFQDEAEDALLLTSVGGQRPPAEIEAALRASLRLCTRDRASLLPGV